MTDVLWLIACRSSKEPKRAERLWCRYADQTYPYDIARMNATPYSPCQRWRNESRPQARLSTLDSAVQLIRAYPHIPNTTLVLFMHGGPVGASFGTAGFLHSFGASPVINTRDMAQDRAWDHRLLPFAWKQRNQNQHYTALTAALRGPQSAFITSIHLYGCQLASTLDYSGIMDFAADTGKEVWAYFGFTYTSHTTQVWRRGRRVVRRRTTRKLDIITTRSSRTPVKGARAVVKRGGASKFQLVPQLTSQTGLLPGWQICAKVVGGTPTAYVFRPAAGIVSQDYVEVWTPASFRKAPPNYDRIERAVAPKTQKNP